jgi:hypothetical protein
MRAWLGGAIVVAACGYPELPKLSDGGAGGDGGMPSTVTKVVTNDVDILVVVDNSFSTTDKQVAFAASFPTFVSQLDAFPGGRPNLHLGVVSTTVGTGGMEFPPACTATAPGDDGLLQNTPRISGCNAPNGRFISDIANGASRTTNYAGTLDQSLSCIAELGSTGCGFEAQLEGMKRALDGSRPENAGFLRPGAVLAIIMLTDEDDCSVADPAIFALNNVGPGDFRCQPLYAYQCDQAISATAGNSYAGCKPLVGSYLHAPAEYVQFLYGLRDPPELVVGVIGGFVTSPITTGPITTPFSQPLALQPSCTGTINGNPAIARPGLRLNDFVTKLGNGAAYYSACQATYTAALGDFTSRMQHAMGPCLDGAIDTRDVDSTNPGSQLACTAKQGGFTLPACTMTDPMTPSTTTMTPCVWYAQDSTCGGAGIGIRVVGGSGSTLTVTCPLQ